MPAMQKLRALAVGGKVGNPVKNSSFVPKPGPMQGVCYSSTTDFHSIDVSKGNCSGACSEIHPQHPDAESNPNFGASVARVCNTCSCNKTRSGTHGGTRDITMRRGAPFETETVTIDSERLCSRKRWKLSSGEHEADTSVSFWKAAVTSAPHYSSTPLLVHCQAFGDIQVDRVANGMKLNAFSTLLRLQD